MREQTTQGKPWDPTHQREEENLQDDGEGGCGRRAAGSRWDVARKKKKELSFSQA